MYPRKVYACLYTCRHQSSVVIHSCRHYFPVRFRSVHSYKWPMRTRSIDNLLGYMATNWSYLFTPAHRLVLAVTKNVSLKCVTHDTRSRHFRRRSGESRHRPGNQGCTLCCRLCGTGTDALYSWVLQECRDYMQMYSRGPEQYDAIISFFHVLTCWALLCLTLLPFLVVIALFFTLAIYMRNTITLTGIHEHAHTQTCIPIWTWEEITSTESCKPWPHCCLYRLSLLMSFFLPNFSKVD